LAKKSRKFKKPDLDSSEIKYTEAPRTFGEITPRCPAEGPRRCPYMKKIRGSLRCTQYTEPWKKWHRDGCCFMYDTYNWGEEDNID